MIRKRTWFLAPLWLGAALLLGGPAIAQPSLRPPPPDLNISEGVSLVTLARSAMNTYLTQRTPVARQAVPVEVKQLESRQFGACVTLRQKGALVGRVTHSGSPLPRNVIAAALEAMRSPLLPDRVTQAVLDELTVEVEVIGPPQPVALEAPVLDAAAGAREKSPAAAKVQQQVAQAVAPGLIGLRLSRDGSSAYVMPSWAYVVGMDGDQMRRECLLELPLTRENASLRGQWSVFATEHYVGDPAGRAVRLVRGKDLPAPESLDGQVLAAAARQIGVCLARGQDKDGRYMPATDAPMLDQLYATWSMARLAAQTGDKALAASANRAVALGVSLVKSQGPRAYVAASESDDQLAATSLLVLALRQMPSSPQGDQLLDRLVAAIRGAIDKDKEFHARLDGSESSAARPRDVCLARMAILDPSGKADAGSLPELSSQTASLEIDEMFWALRARLAIGSLGAGRWEQFHEALQAHQARFAGLSAPADERGGLVAGANPGPDTATTGLAAATLAQIVPELVAAQSPAAADAANELLAARRFCCLMMYRPHEAYFAENGDDWVGAVRAGPQASKVTLKAAAAALDGLLAR